MCLPKIVTFVVCLALPLVSQEKPAEAKSEWEAVIIPVKTLSGDSFNRLAKLLGVFNARYVSDDKLRTIVVYAPPEVVSQMRRVVEELDRPGSEAAIGKNIEATLSFLLCSASAPAGANRLPPELEPVARQLKAATQCANAQLWETVMLHLQEGKQTSQTMRMPMLPTHPAGTTAITQLAIRPEAVTRKQSDRFVRFDPMNISIRVPYSTRPKSEAQNPMITPQFNYADLGVSTAGEFKEGQKTVIGKLSGADDDSSVFVVISLKVLD